MTSKDLINKQVAWGIKLKTYNRKLNSILSVNESEENDIDLCKLRISYNYCIEKLTCVVKDYQYLIELSNDGILDSEFKSRILNLINNNIQAFKSEAENPEIIELEKEYINKTKTTTIF